MPRTLILPFLLLPFLNAGCATLANMQVEMRRLEAEEAGLIDEPNSARGGPASEGPGLWELLTGGGPASRSRTVQRASPEERGSTRYRRPSSQPSSSRRGIFGGGSPADEAYDEVFDWPQEPDTLVNTAPPEIRLGMPMGEVRSLWGDPIHVEVAGDYDMGNQRWIYTDGYSRYSRTGPDRVIYFESGRVAGWERSRGPGFR